MENTKLYHFNWKPNKGTLKIVREPDADHRSAGIYVENGSTKTPYVVVSVRNPSSLDPDVNPNEELKKLKAETVKTINAMQYLTDEQKANFVKKVNDAKTKDEVLAILEEAKKANIKPTPAKK